MRLRGKIIWNPLSVIGKQHHHADRYRKDSSMKPDRFFVICTLLLASNASGAGAATTAGPGALALAALVADRSPTMATAQKHQTAQIFNGNVPSAPTGYTISVRANNVTCRVGDVNLTARSCTLTFGANIISLQGRQANELYATMGEAGIHAQGTAGSFYEQVKRLSCTLALDTLRANTGTGASCMYQ
jgi:hypothetical protein